MIRRVAYKKAIVAGVLGAVAWEIVIRSVIAAGLQMFDLVQILGSMIFGAESAALWWTAGMMMHALVGAIWAVFYAYFFWSLFDRSPIIQGLIFSLLPAVLAGLIMVPQMDLMSERVVSGASIQNGFFAIGVGWGGPAGIILGHLVYGAVLGYLYQNPVGYAVGRRAYRYG